MANMKHYVNNNQEINRIGQSANIDDRTQMEMYYPPFEAAVKSGVATAMCSYNKVNHIYSCANGHTLNYHLRDVMGYDGFVMSDWGAIHGGPKDYVVNGCEQEMGGVQYFTMDAIKNELTDFQLNKAVHRITKTFIKSGLYDNPLPDNFGANVTSEEHFNFAKEAVEKSTILLKNVNMTLPLQK